MKIIYDILVIGAGAAGMMAAAKGAETGVKVLVVEKNAKPGRKIMITGKGRCNITNASPWNQFSTHIHPKPNFIRSSFYAFSNQATVDFFNSHGCKTTLTQGQRIFPESMNAASVVDALRDAVRSSATLITGVDVVSLDKVDNLFVCRGIDESGCDRVFYSRAAIVATGGLSYPLTGSTGKGYEIASHFGHTITRCFPSLTALIPASYDNRLQGIDLKNVAVTLYVDKSAVAYEQGDISFTDNGLEGPVGFRLSRRAVWAMVNGGRVEVEIDLKPAVDEDKLAARIERESTSVSMLHQLLRRLMPEILVAPFTDYIHHSGVSALGIPSPHILANILKHWRISIVDYIGYSRAVVTAGGVSLDEVSQKTMESKKVSGLFFAGEVLDLDGDTGGYNLQIAFSTGAAAGISAARMASATL